MAGAAANIVTRRGLIRGAGPLVLVALVLTGPVLAAPMLRLTVTKNKDVDYQHEDHDREHGSRYGKVKTDVTIDRRTENVTHDIEVRNLAGTAVAALRLEYYIIGTDRSTRTDKIVATSREEFDLKSLETKFFTTDPLEFTEINRRVKHRFVEADRAVKTERDQSGIEYDGVAVIITQNGKRVAKQFMPANLEKELPDLVETWKKQPSFVE